MTWQLKLLGLKETVQRLEEKIDQLRREQLLIKVMVENIEEMMKDLMGPRK